MSALPDAGRGGDEVLAKLAELAAGDVDWRQGLQQGVVYFPGDNAVELAHAAYNRFYFSNALLPREFPSMKAIQDDLLAAAAEVLHGPTPTGVVTTGGTESNMLAVWGAIRRARRDGRSIVEPTVVAPFSAHPSFDKAAYYFGARVVRAPLGDDWRADPEAMRESIDDDTVLLVASAPGYAHGVVDPVEEVGAIATEAGLPLHVDAALGGFMLPFVERIGRKVPTWDFRVPAVSSITADLHKHGYAPKGVSVLMIRDQAQRDLLGWNFEEWPGGQYGTETISGSRSGGAIAGAWAVFQTLGKDGFDQIATEAMSVTDDYLAAIAAIPAIEVFGEPHMNKFGTYAPELSTAAISDGMEARGWTVMRQGPPRGISMQLAGYHRVALERYATDLAEVADLVARGQITDAGKGTSYNT